MIDKFAEMDFAVTFLDIDEENFIAVIIGEDEVHIQVLNYNFECKYDRCTVDLL